MKIGCHWDLTPAQTSLRNFLPLSTALTPYESPRLPSQFPTAVLFLFTSPAMILVKATIILHLFYFDSSIFPVF